MAGMRETAAERRNGSWIFWLGGRLARLAALLIAVSAAAFFLVSLSPVDPLAVNVGQAALGSLTQEQIERLNEYWGVGIPAGRRFLAWFGGILRGDLGLSLLYRRPVLEIIGEKAVNSAFVMAFAWIFSGVAGVALGMAAGARRGSLWDRAITAYCMVISGTPAFWLALVLLLLFAVQLPLFPVGFSVSVGVEASQAGLADRLWHAALPALALGLTGVSNIAMHTRSKMLEIMESDFIAYARSRGETKKRLLFGHALRNVLLPAVTLQFASISEIFGGSVLVEQVFSYPGLGQAAITAGLGSDVPLLLGITLISAILVFAGNTAADLLYGILDPRIRRERRKGALL